jgi:hypothetical protein
MVQAFQTTVVLKNVTKEAVCFEKAGIYKCSIKQSLSQLAVRSKVSKVCDHPLAEIVGSNLGAGMDLCLL